MRLGICQALQPIYIGGLDAEMLIKRASRFPQSESIAIDFPDSINGGVTFSYNINNGDSQ